MDDNGQQPKPDVSSEPRDTNAPADPSAAGSQLATHRHTTEKAEELKKPLTAADAADIEAGIRKDVLKVVDERLAERRSPPAASSTSGAPPAPKSSAGRVLAIAAGSLLTAAVIAFLVVALVGDVRRLFTVPPFRRLAAA